MVKGSAGDDNMEEQIHDAFLLVLQRITEENLVNHITNQYYHKPNASFTWIALQSALLDSGCTMHW
jgi:hypothetical protein